MKSYAIVIKIFATKSTQSNLSRKFKLLNFISNKLGCASGWLKVSVLNINCLVQVKVTTELGQKGKLGG